VLAYYAIANASAWTLPKGHARGSRLVPLLGFAGCVVLAATLPAATVAAGAAILAAGAVVWMLRSRSRAPGAGV
jgi:basic amino acid/polyamine antiporter, APA family